MSSLTLPQGFILRPPTQADQKGIAELFIACDRANYGQAEGTLASWVEWIQTVWRSPSFQLETDAWVVIAPDGRCVGYGTVWHAENVVEELYAWQRIHPNFCGLGLGTFLLHHAEARARQIAEAIPPPTRVALNSWADGANQASQRLLEREGYTPIRYFWRMEIVMDQPPLGPVLPAGITIRPFKQGQDKRAIYETIDAAFQDSWEYVPWEFAEWSHWVFERENFDPSLLFLAIAGDEIAGAIICRVDEEEDGVIGWIDELGVRPAWRKRGLGLALLRQSMGACCQRGLRKCALSVDSQNVAGATRLYERAGMYRSRRYQIRYQKELRSGQKNHSQEYSHDR